MVCIVSTPDALRRIIPVSETSQMTVKQADEFREKLALGAYPCYHGRTLGFLMV